MNPNTHMKTAWSFLRYSYGVVLLLAGLDKVFATNLIVEWQQYISPTLASLLPVSATSFLIAAGIVEVIVALALFSRSSQVAARFAIAWLALISLNLFLAGYIDIAIRDLLLAVGAFVMAEIGLAIRATETRSYAHSFRSDRHSIAPQAGY